MGNEEKKQIFGYKDFIYLALILVSGLSSYFTTKSQFDKRITILETKIGNHDLGVMNQKIDNIEKSTNDIVNKVDIITTTVTELSVELRAQRRGN